MSRISDFSRGVRHIFRGFGFLASHPRLWPWAVLPTLINLALLAVMLGVFVHYYGAIYGWLTAHIGRPEIANPATWYMHVAAALLWAVDLLLQVLVVFLSLIILLIVSYVLGLIIASPFNDALSERVEIAQTGTAPPPFSFKKFVADTIRIVRIETIKALILLAVPIVLFVFNFIPVAGGIIYVFLTFVFGSWALGFSYVDLPMGRRVAPLRTRLAFGRANRWALTGFGLGFAIPFFGLIFAAPMVVGGTLLYVELERNP